MLDTVDFNMKLWRCLLHHHFHPGINDCRLSLMPNRGASVGGRYKITFIVASKFPVDMITAN